MAEQLVLPFETRAARGRGDFIVAPCNEAAVRFIDRWPDWPVNAAAIHGPRGSGKSHLVQVWQARSNAAVIGAAELSDEMPASLAIAVEDMGGEPTPARDRALMSLFERKGHLLLTAERHPADWPVAVADLKSRLAALPAFALWAPDETLLRDLARKLFADRQLKVADAAIARMLTRLPRTPDAIQDFVARLDRFALAERRPIGERLVGELLDRET